jgi:hypothetical protein
MALVAEFAASHTRSTGSLVIGIVFVIVGAGSLAARWIHARYSDGTAPRRELNIPGLSPQVDAALSVIATIVGVVLIVGNV